MSNLVRFFLGVLTGIGLVKAFANSQKERSSRRSDLAATIAAFSRMTLEDLKRILPAENYPSWVSFTEYHKLDWLNLELAKLWPFIDKAASGLIKSSVEPLLDRFKPAILASIQFSELTLGYVVPQFTGVCIAEDDDKGGITMEIEFQWDGNPSITLDVKTSVGVSLPIQVKDVGFTGIFRLIFKPVVDQLPCISAVCFSLRKKKRLNFRLKIIGEEITSIPLVYSAIEETIHDAVESLIMWPARKIFPIIPGDYSDLEMKPVGTLIVKLVQGRDLKILDIIGKSDPFARLYVRPLPDLIKTSKTINNDSDPIWNEIFEYTVEDASTQHLVVKIYDDEGIQSSQIIGCGGVPIDELQPGKVEDMWLDLVDSLDIQRENESMGQVHLELAYCPIGMENKFPNPFFIGRSSMVYINNASENEDVSVANAENTNCQMKRAVHMGFLSVTVMSAEDLSATYLGGCFEPYVKLLLKESEVTNETTAIGGSLHPSWNQTFDFIVEDGIREMLILEVWDEGILGKHYIGRCIMTLTRVIIEGEIEGSYPLETAASGKLNLRLKWTPQAS